MKKIFISLLLTATTALNASPNLSNTRFFFTPLVDAAVEPYNNIESTVVTNSYSNSNSDLLRIAGDYNVSSNLLVGTEIYMPDFFDPDFEPSFISLGGRYQLFEGKTRLAIGSILDIPISASNRMKDDLFLSLFSALRYNVNDKMELAGSFRLRSTEGFEDYAEFLNMGGIYSVTPRFNLIGEMNYSWDAETLYFGSGLQYQILNHLNMRGAIFFNDNDGGLENSLFLGLSYFYGRH